MLIISDDTEDKYVVQVYDFSGLSFNCGPHLAIIGPSEANGSYARKMNIITIITHFCEFTST